MSAAAVRTTRSTHHRLPPAGDIGDSAFVRRPDLNITVFAPLSSGAKAEECSIICRSRIFPSAESRFDVSNAPLVGEYVSQMARRIGCLGKTVFLGCVGDRVQFLLVPHDREVPRLLIHGRWEPMSRHRLDRATRKHRSARSRNPGPRGAVGWILSIPYLRALSQPGWPCRLPGTPHRRAATPARCPSHRRQAQMRL
jgi:hypothetical protein